VEAGRGESEVERDLQSETGAAGSRDKVKHIERNNQLFTKMMNVGK